MFDYSNLPKPLNKGIINEILNACGEANYSVISVIMKGNGCDEGNHYLSEVNFFSIQIQSNDQEKLLDFIIKDMGFGLSDFIVEVKGMDKEVSMYRDILPHVNRLLGEDVTPQMYIQPDETSIVLNDLSPSGYTIANRMLFLDFNHCKLALETLAKYHAGTIKYHEMCPEKFTIVSEETMYNGNQDSIPYYFTKKNVNTVINTLKKIPEGFEFIESVEKFYETFWEDINKAMSTHYDFKVVNQGDFWTTNIMYRYDNGVPISCKLIDFQMARLSSPTFDLFQFITTAMKPSVIEQRLDQLLNIYLSTLNKTLNILGSPQRLLKKDLDSLMERTKVFGILNALVLTQIALCDPSDPMQLSGVSKSDFRRGFPEGDPYEKGYTQKPVQQHIIFLLKFFRRKCYL